MPAPKGHPLWGNPLNIKKYTPEELWEGAKQYFEWCNKHPWKKKEQKRGNTSINVKGDFKASNKALSGIIEMPIQRPYSIEGLCTFLSITTKTFYNYSQENGYETYFHICSFIKQIIDNQHFEGGMTGAFDAGIVARKLGLIDKKQTELNIPNLNINVSSEETKNNIKKLSE